MQHIATHRNGFSIIEISIALVIVGLIVGALSAGTTLLEAARIRNVISEIEEFKNQANLFQSKFNALPGDFSKAGALWGNDCANSSSGSDTCSGNGNGQTLDNDIGSTTSESLRAWQHLDRANIATYSMTGIPSGAGCSSANNCAEIGVNIPESGWPNAGYSFYSGSDNTAALALFLGAETSDNWNSTAVMDPAQAAGIDAKIDDTNPVTGIVRGSSITGRTGGDYASCVDDSTSGSEVYRVANAGSDYCTPAFVIITR